MGTPYLNKSTLNQMPLLEISVLISQSSQIICSKKIPLSTNKFSLILVISQVLNESSPKIFKICLQFKCHQLKAKFNTVVDQLTKFSYSAVWLACLFRMVRKNNAKVLKIMHWFWSFYEKCLKSGYHFFYSTIFRNSQTGLQDVHNYA